MSAVWAGGGLARAARRDGLANLVLAHERALNGHRKPPPGCSFSTRNAVQSIDCLLKWL